MESLKTTHDAQPSKDIWALGCVLSEAATWIVLGKEALLRYQKDRSIATSKLPQLRETSHVGCFHNGHKVLPEVRTNHMEIRKRRRRNDHITADVLTIVEDMLDDAEARPSARQARSRFKRALETAIAEMCSSNTAPKN